ncbi:MAG: PAS domain S-box protein [Burkholderiaceae bacterium]
MHAAPLTLAGLYEQIFVTAADALIVIDAEGRIRLANRQAENLFGYEADALRALGIEDLIPHRFRDNHRRYRNHYRRQPESRPMGMNLALWALHREGHEFPVEISLSPFPMGDETLICANVRDVSELRRARESAVHARQATAIAEFGRQALMSKDVEAVQREACRLATLHLAARRALLLRCSPQRAGLTVAATIGFDDAQLAPVVAMINERWQNPDGIPADELLLLDSPLTIQRTAGQAVTADRLEQGVDAGLMICAIPGEHGRAGVIGVCDEGRRSFTRDDASFLQALANTLGAMLQREHAEERLFQSQRLEALGQLTGGVAHDFNNLLTVVSGNLQILEERLEDPFSLKLARAAMRATGRGADLTRKLLAFSRRQTLQPRPIQIGQLLESLADVLRRTLGARIEVRTVYAPDLPHARADPGLLDTALLNLAVNARDAMPEGGRLTLEARRQRLDDDYAARNVEVTAGDYVEIAVSDTGSGMPPEVLARAFEPFFTTKGSGKGSGLGLSLVYGFVKQSDGHVTVHSEPGIGTTIRLFLPATDDGESPPAAAGETELRSGDETILAVEDDEAVRAVAVEFLRKLGYRVLEASEAADALELLEREPGIDLLFTDIMLRGRINGPGLAREALRRRPGLRVLYTSGYARSAMPVQDELDRRIGVLGKPYPIAQLARMVRRALDGPALRAPGK